MSPHDESQRRYVKGQLDKLESGYGQTKIKLINEGGETFWLNITGSQLGAIKEVLDPPSGPCVIGRVMVAGVSSGFMLPMLNDSVQYSQWGASNYDLGPRADLMDGMATAVAEWAQENLCRTCKEALLDDGEGFDGECGNCADANPDNQESEDDHE